MFSAELAAAASHLIDDLRAMGGRLATAESCTGGLVAGLITEIPGASDVFDRGFVTYSNEAKTELLGVPADLISLHGAVSAEVARAMAEGALAQATASYAIAITGVAGPAGGTPAKPVGLVHIAAAASDGRSAARECSFGPLTRHEIRIASVAAAIALVASLMSGAQR